MVSDEGYHVCIRCGVLGHRLLDVKNEAFDSFSRSRLRTPYTRARRFRSKVIGALNRTLSHCVDRDLLKHLRGCGDRCCGAGSTGSTPAPESPEALLLAIRSWKGSGLPKPYVHVVHYAEELWKSTIPRMSRVDETRINTIFDEVFFAHHRLGFVKPNFPMTELLHLIAEFFELDPATIYLIRFAKRLCCPVRTERYRHMFVKCVARCVSAGKIDAVKFKCRSRKLFDATSRT
jgi:hypothetical protein